MTPSKDYTCWSVEYMSEDYDPNDNPPFFVSNNAAKPSCRPQSFTLFGGSSGYGPNNAWTSN